MYTLSTDTSTSQNTLHKAYNIMSVSYAYIVHVIQGVDMIKVSPSINITYVKSLLICYCIGLYAILNQTTYPFHCNALVYTCQCYIFHPLLGQNIKNSWQYNNKNNNFLGQKRFLRIRSCLWHRDHTYFTFSSSAILSVQINKLHVVHFMSFCF